MSKIIIPENYTPALNLYDTQRAIGTVKRLFADTLCATLNLYRVSAPLFLEASRNSGADTRYRFSVAHRVSANSRFTVPMARWVSYRFSAGV